MIFFNIWNKQMILFVIKKDGMALNLSSVLES